MLKIEKVLSVYLEKTFGDEAGVKVYGINPIGVHLKQLKYCTYGGTINPNTSPAIPHPLLEFFEDYSSYNSDTPEASSVTSKILENQIYLLVKLDEDGRERYAGALHSIEVKRYDDVSQNMVGEVRFRINVKKEERGNGLGKILLEILEGCYLSRGYTLICEFSQQNEAAKRFFEKKGFEIEDVDGFHYRAVKRPSS